MPPGWTVAAGSMRTKRAWPATWAQYARTSSVTPAIAPQPRVPAVTRWLFTIVLAALLAAGCGSSSSGGSKPAVSLALDFTPNAVHAPIYEAVANHRDSAHGIRLVIRKPGSSPDSLKLVAAGRVDVGVLDIHDLALARERGLDLVAVGELVDRPLAALIARASIKRPKDLEGHTV